MQLLVSRDGWERTLSLESRLARGPAWLGATVADTAVGAGQPKQDRGDRHRCKQPCGAGGPATGRLGAGRERPESEGGGRTGEGARRA
ncbi:MAG: hypothetical protein MZV49_05725 [Rhodopseudomonas palustris]|nr:hypothetical protein [Rhodopseudomonas palustris]